MGKLFSRYKYKHVMYGKSSQMDFEHGSDAQNESTDFTNINTVRQLEQVHSEPVTCVVHVDSGVCLSGSKDQTLVLYNYENGKRKQTWLGHEKEVTKVAYGSHIKSYFSGSRDKNINMWQIDSVDPVLQFKGHDLIISGLAINSVDLYDMFEEEVGNSKYQTQSEYCLDVDNSQMCSGSRDNSLRLWCLSTGECLRQNSVTRNLVTHVNWAEDSDIIAQTGEDKEVKIWDARTLAVVQRFARKQHIQSWCDISEDKMYCLTCSNGFQGNGCEATIVCVKLQHGSSCPSDDLQSWRRNKSSRNNSVLVLMFFV
ncbi:hypothetical protein LSH36_1321g00005 [Paralvinella palmiformis]|uniref:Uncharacterized protein n=1 Tax=Paralvinella palmiformis TaxID=53620 RepID=A0AAD9IUW4_9ANNE|nr:hypothetical protein LSH36_1321g00005 [Paralvinella palmiformis]